MNIQENNKRRLISILNNYIRRFENDNFLNLRELKLEKALNSIFSDYKKFANDLFKGITLKFIPLYIVTLIGINDFHITKTNYQEYLELVLNNQEGFINLHDILRKRYFKEKGKDENFYKESINRILLGESSIERSKPLNSNLLIQSIYPQIYRIPYLPPPFVMYSFYLRNLPGDHIKTQLRPMKKVFNERNEELKINRIPWKSRLKVNDFAERYHISDLNKDIIREQYLSDYFNLKKNLKYQLKAVAPRHTLIIDLFFPGRFIYLLAINVNTRKAFAIPSPKIIRRPDGYYVIPKAGHKEIKNIISMMKNLLVFTPIRMLVCDLESAFISNEFKRFCDEKGIKIQNYVKNDIRGLLETKDEKRGVHGLLSIMDRLCRTIRNMAYNIGVRDQEIDPRTMNEIIRYYNNSPHSTFYKIFKEKITPNEMDENPNLEDKLVYQLTRMNFVIRNSKGYDIRCPVRILNEASLFDKLKHKLLPGIFSIEGKDNNLFICRQGDKVIKVPRYMIRPL